MTMAEAAFDAANTNLPLWQQAALRIAKNEAALPELSSDEHVALFEKAALVMKPSRDEWTLLASDKSRQQAYVLAFVRAYKAGLPPVSGLSDAARYTTPRSGNPS